MTKINHKHTSEITCPWCGYESEDSWEFDSSQTGNLGDDECPECKKIFHVTREVEIAYTTEKVKYATCKKCGAENVAVESLDSDILGHFEDFCELCRIQEYVKTMGILGSK